MNYIYQSNQDDFDRASISKFFNIEPPIGRISFAPLAEIKRPSDISNFFKDNYFLDLLNIIGDGNCFFRAISLFLLGNQNSHMLIRFKIRTLSDKTMSHLMQTFGYTQKEIASNLNKTWASDIDIHVASLILSCNIFVFSFINNSWLKSTGHRISVNPFNKSIFLSFLYFSHAFFFT